MTGMPKTRSILSPALWERVQRLFGQPKQVDQTADPYATKRLNWQLEQDIRSGDWSGWR